MSGHVKRRERSSSWQEDRAVLDILKQGFAQWFTLLFVVSYDVCVSCVV